jgi:hypothetical protein
LIDRPLAEIAGDTFGTSFYTQQWQFSDGRLKQTFSPRYPLPQTLADTIAS